MTMKAVQFVLVVRYNRSAHRATYGRLSGPPSTYTKDYLQLSRKEDFLAAIEAVLDEQPGRPHSVPIIYRWPSGGIAHGAFIQRSSDRPHLSWETSVGAPLPWKMAIRTTPETVETIPGDPSHTQPDAADAEFDRLAERGAGYPYLVAVKLFDEENTFHLRVYLRDASPSLMWADFGLLPDAVQEAAPSSTSSSAIGWTLLPTGSVFFDPESRHDAWRTPDQVRESRRHSIGEDSGTYTSPQLSVASEDASAEGLMADEEEVDQFERQLRDGEYSVPDTSSTVKTRGSAQRAFSKTVRTNYGGSCAITGVNSRQFLVASHIVPWSMDETIRLDPANGICLSLLVDKAFELGYLQIGDDLSVSIDWRRVGDDDALRSLLEPYDGVELRRPTEQPPSVDYLRRRRALVNAE
jgi:hypothetical protein